jgi:colicin import membrane protein
MSRPADPTNGLVPPGHRFDVVWRGYDRRQVRDFVDDEMAAMAADRDSAIEMACRMVERVEECRSEIGRLQASYDRICRTPLDFAAIEQRVQRRIQLAEAEASAIVTRARARAEHLRVTEAEERARVDADANQRRRRAEDDFLLAMALRRKESMRALGEYEAGRRAEADQLVADAQHAAAAAVASAEAQVDALHEVEERLAHRLRSVRGLFLRTCALVDQVGGDGVGRRPP